MEVRIMNNNENKNVNEVTEEITNNVLAKRGTVVNAPFVKILKEPVGESEIIAVGKEGDRLSIKKKLNNYYMVEVDGYPGGYILTKYLEEDHND